MALGNTGQEKYIPDLVQALQSPDELVRGHVAWALGRIGGVVAKQILETCLTKEVSDYAREEMNIALSKLEIY